MRRDGTSEFCHPEFGCDCGGAKTESQQYLEGFRAGYATGLTDGKAFGYSDAKARVYAAFNAYGVRLPSPLLDAIRTLLGGTPC